MLPIEKVEAVLQRVLASEGVETEYIGQLAQRRSIGSSPDALPGIDSLGYHPDMDISQKFILPFILLFTITVACSDDDGFLGASNISDGGSDDMAVELDATASDDLSTTVDASSDLSAAPDTGQPVEDVGTDSGSGESDMDGDSGSQSTDMSDDDAGADQGSSKCSGQAIGQACSGRDCPSGYTCEDGRCVPGSGRPTCGGVAGAICTTRAFPECSNFVGADFGPCLSSDEKECACEVNSDLFTCIEN